MQFSKFGSKRKPKESFTMPRFYLVGDAEHSKAPLPAEELDTSAVVKADNTGKTTMAEGTRKKESAPTAINPTKEI